ncbi:ABC transporter permease [Desnuesiella massiliensis]|uniref:ABC transporter permease n=1 Tax=Desnuesiella massiliensis TaxID=1650662 RepID=UPI0006E22296|nr:ABC transporter permease [Desnuesiella massiliensis]
MKLLSLLKKDFIEFKSSFLFFIAIYIAMPLAITFLNGIFFEKLVNPDTKLPKIEVAIIAKENNPHIPAIKEILNNERLKTSINLTEYNSIEEVEAKVKSNEAQAALILSNEGSNNIRFLKSTDNSYTVEILYGTISNYINYSNINYNNSIKISELKESNAISAKQVFGASMLALLSLFIAMTGASNFLKEKESMTLLRMNSIPIGFNSIYGEKLLLTFIISLIQSIAFIILCGLLGINFYTNISLLILIIASHAFALTGIAGFMMNFFLKEKTLSNVFTSIIMFMAVLGGSFFPAEYVSQSFQKASKFTINYWIQNSYTRIMSGEDLNSLITNISVLLSIGTIGILLGFLLNKKNKSFA